MTGQDEETIQVPLKVMYLLRDSFGGTGLDFLTREEVRVVGEFLETLPPEPTDPLPVSRLRKIE